jgi:hypothetical protein
LSLRAPDFDLVLLTRLRMRSAMMARRVCLDRSVYECCYKQPNRDQCDDLPMTGSPLSHRPGAWRRRWWLIGFGLVGLASAATAVLELWEQPPLVLRGSRRIVLAWLHWVRIHWLTAGRPSTSTEQPRLRLRACARRMTRGLHGSLSLLADYNRVLSRQLEQGTKAWQKLLMCCGTEHPIRRLSIRCLSDILQPGFPSCSTVDFLE